MPDVYDIQVEEDPNQSGRHMLRNGDGLAIAPMHLDVTDIRIKSHGDGWQALITFRIAYRDDTATHRIEAESLPLLLFAVDKAIMDDDLIPFRQYKLWWGLYQMT